MADSSEAPAGLPKARRRIFQCSECDEVFVDEESLKRHEATHRPPPPPPAESGGEDDAPPPPRRRPGGAAAAAAEAAPPSPAGRGRAMSQVREEAGIEAPDDLLSGGLGPSALDANIGHLDPDKAMSPLGWEQDGPRPSMFRSVYGLLEDFSEFFFHGMQRGAGVAGHTLVPAVSLALKGLLAIALCAGLVISGMLVGRRFSHAKLWSWTHSTTVTPVSTGTPQEDSLAEARDVVVDFYHAIDGKDLAQAYDDLSPAWKRELPYAAFERGYRSTEGVKCKVDRAHRVGSHIEVDVSLLVTERGATKKVSGTYVAQPTSEGWKLDSGSFRE